MKQGTPPRRSCLREPLLVVVDMAIAPPSKKTPVFSPGSEAPHRQKADKLTLEHDSTQQMICRQVEPSTDSPARELPTEVAAGTAEPARRKL